MLYDYVVYYLYLLIYKYESNVINDCYYHNNISSC